MAFIDMEQISIQAQGPIVQAHRHISIISSREQHREHPISKWIIPWLGIQGRDGQIMKILHLL